MESKNNYFDFLKNTKIILTNEIQTYKNKSVYINITKGNKCINELEIVEKISRGLFWKVYKALRYFENDSDELITEPYVIKVKF